MEKNELLEFVRRMKPTDHVILFYQNPEDKHLVLFTYPKAGLDQDEAAVYVGTQESQLWESMTCRTAAVRTIA
jgi:hypothetical protein